MINSLHISVQCSIFKNLNINYILLRSESYEGSTEIKKCIFFLYFTTQFPLGSRPSLQQQLSNSWNNSNFWFLFFFWYCNNICVNFDNLACRWNCHSLLWTGFFNSIYCFDSTLNSYQLWQNSDGIWGPYYNLFAIP